MVTDIEKTIKYPLNFKPLFIMGMIFLIIIVLSFIPMFYFGPKAAKESAASEFFTITMAVYIISLLASMVLISLFIGGYLMRVSRCMIAGNVDKAPELNRIGDLFSDGLKYMVLGFVYSIPPIIMAVLAVVVFNILGILLMIFLIPLFYVFQLAGVHLAQTNSLRKALDIPFIYSMVFNNLKDFTLALFISFAASLVFSIAGILIITYPFLVVASYVSMQYVFTIFYIESTRKHAENIQQQV